MTVASLFRKYTLIRFWKSAVCDLTKGTDASRLGANAPQSSVVRLWGKTAAVVMEQIVINKVQ